MLDFRRNGGFVRDNRNYINMKKCIGSLNIIYSRLWDVNTRTHFLVPTDYYMIFVQDPWECLVWDARVKAPIGSFMVSSGEVVPFVTDLVGDYQAEFTDIPVSSFIVGNQAGPGGKELNWKEIKETYT